MKRAGALPLDDEPWWLWRDLKAPWRDDPLHLPGEVELEDLPTRPPTGGWRRLSEAAARGDAKAVMLPTTVEAHFWDAQPKRQLTTREYFFASRDPLIEDGVYRGVSWWWRDVTPPRNWRGQRLTLRFSGVRLRAEVFVNRTLVGYDLIAETPFSVEVTAALRPGVRNQIAVRITNPGGRLDWVDFHDAAKPDGSDWPTPLMLTWGEETLPVSHGFGGIDAGVWLEATGACSLEDVFIQNRSDVTSVAVEASVRQSAGAGPLRLEMQAAPLEGGLAVARTETTIAAGEGASVTTALLEAPGATPWTPEQPQLYKLSLRLWAGEDLVDEVSETFGFRWFTADGLGERAGLRLNGSRIRLRSAISWNFWSGAGLFPRDDQIQAEIAAAKALGLNMLTCHRNLGSARALTASDRAGLLRWEEPGAGRSAWQGASNFERGYMREKIARMVRRDRNHPSLVVIGLQNEQVSQAPLEPRVRATMEMVRALDPTRIIVLKSAFADATQTPEDLRAFADKQAFFLPGDATYHHDRGDGWSGWWDNHTVGGPGVWQDWIYAGPDDFSHGSKRADEIVIWGEALGSASPEDLAAAMGEYRAGRIGWERTRFEAQHAAYSAFLARSGFRRWFPDVGALTRSIADRSYHFWARVLENARISDAVDGLAISGWESSPFENHCGIVDLFRRPKGDPRVLAAVCGPRHLAVKPRGLVHGVGDEVVVDLHLVNETGRRGRGRLRLTLEGPASKRPRVIGAWEVEWPGGDRHAQLLVSAVATGLQRPGYWRLGSTLETDEGLVRGGETIFAIALGKDPYDVDVVEARDHLSRLLAASGGRHAPGARTRVVGEVADGELALQPEWLADVRAGGRLVLLADGGARADDWAKRLQAAGVVTYEGSVGPALASWTGSWYVAGDDVVFAGLPARGALSWEYQADPRGGGAWFDPAKLPYFGDGLKLTGPHVETLVAYGRDHQFDWGSALARIRFGAGEIIISAIGGLYASLGGSAAGLHPLTARKLVRNMLTAPFASDGARDA